MAFLSERKTLLNSKTLAIVAASSLFLLSILLVGEWLVGGITLGILVIAGFLMLIAIGLESYYRLYEQNYRQGEQIQALLKQHDCREKDYQQIEALFSLIPLLKLRYPLPSMRDWAASPDFLTLIVSLILERQPKLVVEASSGVSTLVTAYGLEKIGLEKIGVEKIDLGSIASANLSADSAQVISLEHEAEYVARNRIQVIQHGLQATAKIIHAPLAPVSIHQQDWLWYDLNELKQLVQNNNLKIDFLIIDGPPQSTQKLARYPALPLLFDWLSNDAIVLLDDADREDEQQIVQQWQQEFSNIDIEWISTEKGACILQIKKQN